MKKILLLFTALIVCISTSFALDANLNVNPTNTDINQTIQVKIEVNAKKGEHPSTVKLKGLENFDVVGQNTFNSMSTEIISINGKTKSVAKITQTLILILKAKQAGKYTIGPAIIDYDNGKEYKTNAVNITITGKKLFNQNINTQTNYNPPSSNTNNTNLQQNSTMNNQKITIPNINIEKKQVQKDNSVLYFIITILILIGIMIVIYVLQNKEEKKQKLEEKKQKLEEKITENPETKKEIENINENQVNVDISNLSIEDKDLVEKIDLIARKIIAQKYNITNIESKTYNEIINLTNDKNIKQLFKQLELLKYSNFITDKEQAIKLLKNII